jgi:hypothetical protein
MDHRKIRDAIRVEKEKEFPKGLGWEGNLVIFILS